MSDCYTEFQFTCCDSCSQKSVCAIFYHYGVPVLATCKACDAKGYQYQAARQIDQWLTKR